MSSEQSFNGQGINRGSGEFETIRQLAKRHMMDQFHTTTDEELKNAVVELDSLKSTPIELEKNISEDIA